MASLFKATSATHEFPAAYERQHSGASTPVTRTPTSFVVRFLAGTLIATDGGEVSIERLKIGDMVGDC